MGKRVYRLEKYIPLVKFLSKVLGNNAEIILFDAVEKNIYYSENPFNDSHNPKEKMSEVDLKVLESKRDIIDREDYVVNYRNFTQGFEKLRSSTYFIKDKEKDQSLLGMLSINIRVNDYIKMRELIEEMISGGEATPLLEKKPLLLESFDFNFEDMMNSTIQAEVNKIGVAPERLSAEEKYEIILELDKKGTFLMKGSVQEAAKVLNCSEVTIYRYLQNIK